MHLHRVDTVRWSRRVCKRHRKCWKFSNVIILPHPKALWQYQRSNMDMPELPVDRFLLISKKQRHQNCCPARARFYYNPKKAAVTEERLKCLSYLEPWIFEYEFRYIISHDVWLSRQALAKWRIRCPKLIQDGMLNMSSWYKRWLTFTAVNL